MKRGRNALKKALFGLRNERKPFQVAKEIPSAQVHESETIPPPEPVTPIIATPTDTNEEPVFDPITKHNFYKHPIFWARFLGYALPLSFLLYVLYLNYLPFGYHKTFTIDVGSANDTKVSEFYLEPSPSLSERKTKKDSLGTYREINGMALAIFKPSVTLRDPEINVEVKGDGVSIIPLQIQFDPSTLSWDKNWDFTKEISTELINKNVYFFDGESYFDGTANLELATSTSLFEDGPFSVYAEWKPLDNENDFQEIVGHFNWELVQNKQSVQFQVGRTNNTTGTIYYIKSPIEKDFFNKKHSAIATYMPGTNGYIELFIDNNFIGRAYMGADQIWKEYGGESNLSIGWSKHNYGKSPHFKGSIYKINITNKNVIQNQIKTHLKPNTKNEFNIPLVSVTSSTLSGIELHVKQK